FAVRRVNAQGVAPPPPMPAQADRKELRAVPDQKSRGFGGPPIQEGASSHVGKSGEEKFPWILPYPPPVKSLGAKTNHLPNIQGLIGCEALQEGAGTENSSRAGPAKARPRTENQLIPSGSGESGPFWVDSGGVGHSNHHRIADPKS